jgi:hypothetical protein
MAAADLLGKSCVFAAVSVVVFWLRLTFFCSLESHDPCRHVSFGAQQSGDRVANRVGELSFKNDH